MKKGIEESCAFSLILLFVYTAVNKLLRQDLFRFQLNGYPWIGHFAAGLVWGLPAIELLIPVLLISTRARGIGFFASFGLLVLFTGYLLTMLGTQRHLPCACGGVLRQLTWRQHVFFNLFFLALSGIGIAVTRNLRHSSPQNINT
jgi:putative oxidoreductase